MGCKACQILTGHLFETQKGWYLWDREGRRHFQRARSEDCSFARQALSWTASEVPAWSSSLGVGGGGGTMSNPALVFLAQAPALSLGSPHAAHPARTRRGVPRGPSALGSRRCPGEQCFFCLPHSVTAAVKAAIPGETEIYHLVQL